MEATVVETGTEGKTWGGGNQPLKASYGKMMMWFFIVSDALTFSGFLASYGFSRFKFVDAWPIADQVFTHVPFLHGVEAPMYYVAFMTFILIFSSVTMVLAVDAGHKMQQKKVILYLFLTIIGGAIFVGSQLREVKYFSSWIQMENELLFVISLLTFLPLAQNMQRQMEYGFSLSLIQ
jgi:cytochrome c oxidase subunit 3